MIQHHAQMWTDWHHDAPVKPADGHGKAIRSPKLYLVGTVLNKAYWRGCPRGDRKAKIAQLLGDHGGFEKQTAVIGSITSVRHIDFSIVFGVS